MPEIERYPPVGPDHPLAQLGELLPRSAFGAKDMVLRLGPEQVPLDYVGDCTTEKNGEFQLLRVTGTSEPVVRSKLTGKVFHLPWKEIVSMGLARGLNEK